MNIFGYIYKTTNLINNKIYIGQHKGKKFDKFYYGSGKIIKNALEKYGLNNFKVELIKFLNNQKLLDAWESLLILFAKNHKDGCYNIKDFGKTSVGFKYSEESKIKMSKSRMGNQNSKGIKHTDESKRKISEGRKKYLSTHKVTYSEESKIKMSKAKLKSWAIKKHLKLLQKINGLQIIFPERYTDIGIKKKHFKPNIEAKKLLDSLI